jgi:hypothetical protein
MIEIKLREVDERCVRAAGIYRARYAKGVVVSMKCVPPYLGLI